MLSSEEELATRAIIDALQNGRILPGIEMLRSLKENIYAAIPEKQRISRGITWVMQHIGSLFSQTCQSTELKEIGRLLFGNLAKEDTLLGVPIFIMGEYGKSNPPETYIFFEEVADSSDWIVREFAQAGFRPVIGASKELVSGWLKEMAVAERPNLRRFVAETLRPVTTNRWMNQQPEYSLDILGLLFREAHPYPRTSVGNNLSDLSRRQPELIFENVIALVESGDPNSYWIAYRACRNLVKNDPGRVMQILGVGEYHYKDRNFYSQSNKKR